MREWRAALRSLSRRRGLSATIVLTLALGIGANSAIFSAVDAVLLKPLPYPEPDRLVRLYELNLSRPGATQLVAPTRIEAWHEANRTLDGIAGSYFENLTETVGSVPERVEAMRTSPRFFAVLGVPPALGRWPTLEEEQAGGPKVVVLSDAVWRSRFNADPAVIGRTWRIGGGTPTIIAVMPPKMRYPTAATQAWLPVQAPQRLLEARQARFYTAFARLKPGVTLEQARDDLDAIQSRLGEQYPETDKGWGASLVPLKEEQVARCQALALDPARCRRPGAVRGVRQRRLPAARGRDAARARDGRCGSRSALNAARSSSSCWSKAASSPPWEQPRACSSLTGRRGRSRR